MAFWKKLISGGVHKIVDSVGSVIDQTFTSDDERQKNQIVMAQVQTSAALAIRELEAKLEVAYLADAADLRKQITAEINSEDPYVRRARPTFNYIFYCVMLFNYIAIPMVQALTQVPLKPVDLPVELWTVFGVGFIGYGYMRHKEKGGPGIAVPPVVQQLLPGIGAKGGDIG